MFKSIRDMVIGAFVAGLVGVAMAAVGQPPVQGFQTPDGTWLLGLSNGQNYSYQSGLSAAGTTQATSTQLPAAIYLMEVDTAAASSGVAVPPCVPGTQFVLYNNGAQTLTIYPAIANNLLTAAQDTINNGTSYSGGLASHASIAFACAKAGNWNAS